MEKALQDVFDYDAKLKILLENHTSKEASDMIKKAFFYAQKWHEKSPNRGTGEPFIQHPIRVALIVNDMKADYKTICSALLHDTIEDIKNVTYEKIATMFSPEIASLVDGVTKISSNGQDASLNHVKTVNKQILNIEIDPRIMLIKLADRLDNIRTVDGLPEEKRKYKARETEEVYVPMARLLGLYEIMEELADRTLKILKKSKYDEIEHLKNIEYVNNDALLEALYNIKCGNEIRHGLSNIGIRNVCIDYKFKSVSGIVDRMEQYPDIIELSQIRDLITFKFTLDSNSRTNFYPELYMAMGYINSLYKPINLDGYCIKDFVANPKYNYYQGIHTSNIIPIKDKGLQVKFQYRTQLMKERANLGIASLWDYDNVDAKSLMKASLASDFPFYADLRRICDSYNRGDLTDKEFYERLKKITFSKRIFINTKDYGVIETYDGCLVKDFLLNVNHGLIDSDAEYYVDGKKVGINEALYNNQLFEQKSNNFRRIYK